MNNSRLKSKISTNLFEFPITCPYAAYFLGHFWGDGYLQQTASGQKIIAIDVNQQDFLELLPIYSQIGKWNIINDLKKKSKAISSRAYSSDGECFDILESMGMRYKTGSHELCFDVISEEYHKYFIRGLIDADGHICFHKSSVDIGISSGIDQNWEAIIRCLQIIDINPKIKLRKHKNGNVSILSVSTLEKGYKFLNWVYSDFETNQIGLNRKYKSFLIIKNAFEEFEIRKHKYSEGRQFGNLTIIGPIKRKDGNIDYKCKCFCGKECVAGNQKLRDGQNQNCGCLKVFLFNSPIGDKVEIRNLLNFCEEKELAYRKMLKVFHGEEPSYKGWTKFV